MTRHRILHISADYPDAYSARKTSAVQNLIEGTPEFEHRIYSINRINGLGGITPLKRNGDVTTLVYRAPPYGIFLDTFLGRLADWILRDIPARGMTIDLVHAHKLTIEGLVARRVAQALGCPYVCTVRGNTDQKYIRLKPEMRATWRQVARQAAWLFPVTPWIERYLLEKLSPGATPCSLLPTITKIDHFLPPRHTQTHLVTAFHLDGWRLKGMPNLLAALARLSNDGCPVGLDIIGSDTGDAGNALRHEIRRHNLADQVKLLGAVSHNQMLETLNGYTAFVLPTLRETFGMVYIEALFAGVPILYSQDRGVDGFFDEQGIGVRCDPTSIASIVENLKVLLADAERMKQVIAMLQGAGGLERFRQGAVCCHYAERIHAILGEWDAAVALSKR